MTEIRRRRRRPAPPPERLIGKPLFIGLAAGAAIVGLPAIVLALSGGSSAAESVRAIDVSSEAGREELRQVQVELMKKALDVAGARVKKSADKGEESPAASAPSSRAQGIRDKILGNSDKALELSIKQLNESHKTNPIAALNKYRGRLIRIRGEVVSVQSSLALSLSITDAEGGTLRVHMLPSEKTGLAALAPGDSVTVLAIGKAQSYQAFPLINGVLAP